MNIRKTGCFIICWIIFTATTYAQTPPLLTLKDAVEIALKNNYNIKLAQNNSAIAQNNVTLGNARILPTVSGSFSSNNSVQNITQTRVNATTNITTTTNIPNSRNTSIAYGPVLNWTVFDGFAMFANYDQLKQLNQLGEIRARDTIQNTIANVISTYYNLINLNEQLKALQGAMDITRTQLRYANDKFQVGRASRLDLLNAQVNLNTDTASYLNQLQQFKFAKVQMNQLLVRDPQTDFTVADTIIVDTKLTLGDILSKAQSQNPAILSAQINKRLADINLRQVKATRYPQVGVNTGYAINSSKSPAGFARAQSSNGFNYGLTASLNIFDGFNQSRKERNAKIQIDNANISYNRTMLNIEAEINNFYISYLSGLDLIKLGQSNVAIAKRNLDISLEKYKLGNITPLEIREAERNYLEAQSKFFAAQYQSKNAEITLKLITNSINIQ